MEKESSIKKGDKLEKEVFEIFQRLLSDGSYYFTNKSSKVFFKKGYYSKDRQSDIIFDVSIETYLNGSNEFSLLTLIECKNLNKNVSIDDIEEFSSKISQIGKHNTKGIVITSVGYQESAYNYGKSKKIALARIQGSNNLEWLSHRKDKKISVDETEFNSSNTIDHLFISNFEGKLSDNIPDLLIQLSIIDIFIDKEELIFIPFVTVSRINYIVDKLSKYDLYIGCKLDFEKLIALMEERYNVIFEFDTEESTPYLGKIEFNPLKIKISKRARINENLWRFTLAHEIGHLILHSKHIKNRIESKIDFENSLTFKYENSNRNVYRMEFQANMFASTLLLPDNLLIMHVFRLFKEYDIRRGRLYLDSQPVNQKDVFGVLYRLSSIFNVSIDSIKIRLIKLDLLIDDTDKRFGTLLRKYYSIKH